MSQHVSRETNATADAGGNAVFTFPSERFMVFIGTLSVPNAPSTATHTVTIGSEYWGVFSGNAISNPLETSLEQMPTLTSTGLTPGATYSCQLIGSAYDTNSESLPDFFPPAGNANVGTGATIGGMPVILRANSIPDLRYYESLIDVARRLTVTDPTPSWWIYPVGRLHTLETFEGLAGGATPNGRGWYTVAGSTGTQNVVATNAHEGVQSLALAPAAVAGAQAGVQKGFVLFADQGFFPSPEIIIGAWFNPVIAGANWRAFDLHLFVDDSSQQWEAQVLFTRRQAGVTQNALQLLDSAGAIVTEATYQIDDSDVWHLLVMVLDYKQGTPAGGGYMNYRQVRVDDFNVNFAAAAAGGFASASSGVRKSTLRLTATGDNGAGAGTILVDDVVVSDLSSMLNQ